MPSFVQIPPLGTTYGNRVTRNAIGQRTDGRTTRKRDALRLLLSAAA